MNQCFVYHPYKMYKYVLPIVIGFCILGFLFAGGNLFQGNSFAIFFLIASAGLLCCIVYLSNRTNIVVVFEENGLHITMGKRKYYQFVPWDSLQYAYEARNYKGYQFLILSPTMLEKNKIQKYVWEGTDGKNIYQDSVVVIHLSSMQDTTKIKDVVTQQGLQFEK